MLQINRQLPAKVLKRAAQLRRLGPRGLMRTAYVRTLGPTIYSLTEPARSVAAGLHRRRALGQSLPYRWSQLKKRVAAEVAAAPAAGLRIEFGPDLGRFIQTLEAMLDLSAAGCAVPSVVAVEWSTNAITTRPIKGTLLSNLVRRGQLEEGTLDRLEEALVAVHRTGYVVGEISGEDIICGADGSITITDLKHAVSLHGLSRDMSVHLRDEDRNRFNLLFGTRLFTAKQLRRLLSPNATIPHDRISGQFSEVYAPVVIRDDIRWGKIWNTDLGTGRWNFIMKDHLPIPIGGRVLDLGSNNGFNPLQMLRAGASSAVGIEIHEPAINQAMFLKSAFEWLDNRSYDFRCIHGSQGDLASLGLPRFDIVTALCSLYYLPDAQIRDLLRYIRSITDVLVLQCNEDRLIDRGGNEDTYRKASLSYAIEILDQAGFTDRTIIAPAGYSRPLVIGRFH